MVNDSLARLAVSYFTTTPLSLVLDAPPELIDVQHPSQFKLGTSGEYLGLFSKSAETAECGGVISNGKLLDSFRRDIIANDDVPRKEAESKPPVPPP